MEMNLTCTQVKSLINFYFENKLNPELKKLIDIHLQKCPECRAIFEEQKNNIKKNNFLDREFGENNRNINNELINNLSAYMDNELNSGDNIKIKKMTITNPNTRKKLETMYKFQKLIHSAYEKTKSDNKFDYSKNIISILNDGSEYTTNYFNKIAALFVILIICIISGFIYLYF